MVNAFEAKNARFFAKATVSFDSAFDLFEVEPSPVRSDQSGLLERRSDEPCKQWMRIERTAFELGVELHPDEPRMIGPLDDFGKQAIG